jgi:hypothetical protein
VYRAKNGGGAVTMKAWLWARLLRGGGEDAFSKRPVAVAN